MRVINAYPVEYIEDSCCDCGDRWIVGQWSENGRGDCDTSGEIDNGPDSPVFGHTNTKVFLYTHIIDWFHPFAQ